MAQNDQVIPPVNPVNDGDGVQVGRAEVERRRQAGHHRGQITRGGQMSEQNLRHGSGLKQPRTTNRGCSSKLEAGKPTSIQPISISESKPKSAAEVKQPILEARSWQQLQQERTDVHLLQEARSQPRGVSQASKSEQTLPGLQRSCVLAQGEHHGGQPD
jgi:hypothetical protein